MSLIHSSGNEASTWFLLLFQVINPVTNVSNTFAPESTSSFTSHKLITYPSLVWCLCPMETFFMMIFKTSSHSLFLSKWANAFALTTKFAWFNLYSLTHSLACSLASSLTSDSCKSSSFTEYPSLLSYPTLDHKMNFLQQQIRTCSEFVGVISNFNGWVKISLSISLFYFG